MRESKRRIQNPPEVHRARGGPGSHGRPRRDASFDVSVTGWRNRLRRYILAMRRHDPGEYAGIWRGGSGGAWTTAAEGVSGVETGEDFARRSFAITAEDRWGLGKYRGASALGNAVIVLEGPGRAQNARGKAIDARGGNESSRYESKPRIDATHPERCRCEGGDLDKCA